MRASAQKITTAAVCTALAVLMCAMSAYLPLSIMPLYFASFCIFLACKRGSVVYGLLCAVATVGIMFAFVGLSVKWFFLLVMFAPYGMITCFVHRFSYFSLKTGIVRGLVAAAYFNLTAGGVYLIATRVLTAGIDVPLEELVSFFGGYAVLALVATVVLVPLDFIFSTVSGPVLKRLPAAAGGKGKSKADFYGQKKSDDVFGYDDTPENGEGGDGQNAP